MQDMTHVQVRHYMAKIEAQLADGTLAPQEALQRAFVLGCETARMDDMHRACAQYSEAQRAREAAFGDSVRPPGL
jgi:hypothetical protein